MVITKPMSGSSALKFVVLLGFVSLLADVTYEGARSINGSFMAVLGANATTVGVVAGSGELIGYAFRLVSGYLSDRTQRYWAITITGYFINLFAVPLLAWAGHWPFAAALMIAERFGKAIRNPARDAMLSHATQEMGRGWGFALHEAMDQIGAMLGPLIVTLVLYLKGDYRKSYAVLLVPAVLALLVLFFARFLYPRPHDLELDVPAPRHEGFSKRYWLYLSAVALVAAGYADFPLIAYHFEKVSSVPKIWIPALYSLAMGVDAVSALIFGRWFDKKGLRVLVVVTLLSACFAPFVFLGKLLGAAMGMALWGVGMSAQESVMRAAVSEMISKDKRGTAFGVFNTGYGVAWFLGSVAMGFLYDRSVVFVIIFSVAAQLLAVPLFYRVGGRKEFS